MLEIPQSGSRWPSISVVLPAYNEEAVIAQTVGRVAAALRAAEVNKFEILVVDDGSQDQTAARAEQAAGRDAAIPLRVIRHSHNRGYGGALRTGFSEARMDAVWLMDSDGQFDPSDIELLLPHYGSRIAVFAYRGKREDPFLRRANHAAFFALVRALCGATVRDVNCAFKLFPAELGRGLQAEGAIISTELVLRARRLGYTVVELAVPHYPRTTGHATGASPRVVLRAFVELWTVRKQQRADARRSKQR